MVGLEPDFDVPIQHSIHRSGWCSIDEQFDRTGNVYEVAHFGGSFLRWKTVLEGQFTEVAALHLVGS